ncbi:MAG: PAS domain-containing protein [Sulfurimonadaceae bacterium]|jgi:PAS domain S-box-containing protein|nr:PAS domain-containing protein [Arcobacteraceae bacterium]MDX9795733.1 PAS domain-containing protein [Arcobacteraceae bacterium]
MQITPTNAETKLESNDFIVSKTDSKGKITYCNEIFMSIAGYKEEELMGKNHNIIRHPDMPKVAFKLAWELIQNGKEFFGFVKNMKKDGGFYWVFANITPDYDENQHIIGYTSVRRKPNENAIETIIPLYKKLLELEMASGMKTSEEFLSDFLIQNNTNYDDLIISLQG